MENAEGLTDIRVDRNAAGTGSRPRLRKDGLWCVHLSCGSSINERGEAVRVRRSVYGRTAGEAERKAAALRAALASGASTPGQVVTVADLLARWLARKRACAPSTYTNYEQHVRRFLMPRLGDRPLASLSANEVEDFVVELSVRTSRRGTPFAPGTVRLSLIVLRQALTYAAARGLIPRNVAAAVRPPRGAARRPRFLSIAEATRLLAAARGDRREALYRVAIVLGLRQGELLGLRWANVDL